MTKPTDPVYPVKAHRVEIPKTLMTAELLLSMREYEETIPGLSKREYFAAMAMRGCTEWDALMNQPDRAGIVDSIALSCVKLADALVAALNKREGDG